MKKLLLIFILYFVSACNTSIPPIEIKVGSFQEAIEEAHQKNKTLIAIVSKEGCTICDIFPNQVKTVFNSLKKDSPAYIDPSKYIFYKIDTDIPENVWVNQWLNELAFPTSCIISPSGRLITSICSGKPSSFFNILKQVDKGKTDSIYNLNMTRLNLKDNALQQFLTTVLSAKIAMLHSEKSSSIKDSLLASLKVKSYFYNNYLLSKYYQSIGDTTQAKQYANVTLGFKEEIDAMLYTPLRTEMNYIADGKFNIADEPYLAAETIEYDYGEMKPGATGSASFTIINKGKKPLLLERAVASCSCTSVDWDKKPIAPGQKTSIKVSFKDKVKQAGLFQQSVALYSNAYNSPLVLTVKAKIF